MMDSSQFYSSVSTHFIRGNLDYDDKFTFREQPVGELCLKYLNLQPEDLLVDVGAGTGNTTEPIWRSGVLKTPILCVDPSVVMLEACKEREGLEPHHASSLEFFSDKSKFRHNKVLICDCIHLWGDLQETLDSMFRNSPSKFTCVIVTHVPGTKLAFWKAAKERFEVTMERGYAKTVEKALADAGFKVQTTDELIVYKLTKAQWYHTLKNRSFIALERFSDAEIEEGLRELDDGCFSGVAMSDTIEIQNNLAVIVATKEQ